MEIRIRDKRSKGWFYLDNEYLNGYARVFGAIGTAIYVSLCRHVDLEQKCFPSQELIAEELNIAPRTVRKYLKMFQDYNLIHVHRQKTNEGKWLNNIYYLLDKSEWLPIHGQQMPMAKSSKPEANESKNQRHQLPNKDTHIKNTHIAPKNGAWVSLKQAIQKLEENPRRDLNIIALFFEERNPDIQNADQYQIAVKRHLRAAKQLIPFTNQQILTGVKKAKEQTPEWTLETVIKMLTK